MTKVKNGALMIVVGTLAYFFIGVMYVWSIIRIELTNIHPEFTAAQLSMCFTLMMSTFCIGGFVGGKLVQRKTPALSLRIAAVLILLGYTGASMTRHLDASATLTVLYIFYSSFGGFGMGMTYNALLTNISPWFPSKVGLVSGVLLMGMGISSLVFAFIIEAVCPYIGIFNVFLALGIIGAVIVLLSSFVVKKPPVAAGNTLTDSDDIQSKTPGEMLKSPSFWVYFIWNVFSGCTGLLIINSAANIAAYFGLAASLGLVISIFNGCGRPVVGTMVDRFGRFKAMCLLNIMLVAAAVMLIISDKTGVSALMFVGMILVGIVYGGAGTMGTRVIRDLYGPKHYGVNHSISNFCVVAASFVGPYLSGLLQDRSGGGFTSSFYMLLFIALVMLVLLFALQVVIKKETKS